MAPSIGPLRDDDLDYPTPVSVTLVRPSTAHLRVFDIAKTYAIVAVVVYHAFLPQFYRDEYQQEVPTFFLAQPFLFLSGFFVMQALFFASGYLFLHTRGYERARGYVSFLARKASRLMPPYLVLSAAAFAAKFVFNRYAARPVDLSLREFVLGLLYPTTGPILLVWFLAALLLMFTLAPLVHRVRTMRAGPLFLWTALWAGLYFVKVVDLQFTSNLLLRLGVLETFPFSVLHRAVWDPVHGTRYYALFSFSQAMEYFFFFWLGAVAFRYQTVWRRVAQSRRVAAAAWIAILSAGMFWSVHFDWARLFDRLTMLMGPFGLLAAYTAATAYLRRGRRYLDTLSKHSFTIYLTSWFFQQAAYVACRVVFARAHPSADAMLWISVVALTVAGLGGPVALGYVARRWRLPGRFLIGA